MTSELERLLLRVDAFENANKNLQEKVLQRDAEIQKLDKVVQKQGEELLLLRAENTKVIIELEKLRKELRKYKNENTPSGAIPPYLKDELQRAVQEPTEQREPKQNPRNERQAAHRTEQHILLACPGCGGELTKKKRRYKRIISHLQLPTFENVLHDIQAYYCPCCKKEVVPDVPGALPNCKFDMTTAIFISYLFVASNMTMGGIKNLFSEVFNTPISKGTISNTLVRLKEYLGDEYAFLEREITKAKSRNRDETSWRKNGKTMWNWVVATRNAVVYRIEKSRGHENALRYTGKRGVDTMDGYAAYNNIEGEKQRCWSHLKRVAKDPEHPFAIDQEIEDYKKLVQRLGEIFHQAKEDKKQLGCSKELRKRYDKTMLECLQKVCWHSKNSDKLINYILKLDGEWFTFLEFPEVDPTNNRAERALRHIVLKRKISQQSRGDESTESYAVQASLFMSARQKGENYMEYLSDVVNEKLHDDGKS